ncbi:hypothetical protein E3U43_001450 [Larimichthys crocea]|uniref:Uncharacterized protein n=1 Tax=Larimichthys crocea TaxID=215358 RepID=A0ACD3RD30_LARCR|nr:hypothetical protein E3U43_001450 [Larimichthys crocea]
MDDRISIIFLILQLIVDTPFMNSMEDPRWTHGRRATGVNEHENLLERSCQGEEYFQDLKEKVKRRMLSKSCPNIPSELDDSDLNPLNEKWKSMDIRRDLKKESFEDNDNGIRRSASSAQPDCDSNSPRVKKAKQD